MYSVLAVRAFNDRIVLLNMIAEACLAACLKSWLEKNSSVSYSLDVFSILLLSVKLYIGFSIIETFIGYGMFNMSIKLEKVPQLRFAFEQSLSL